MGKAPRDKQMTFFTLDRAKRLTAGQVLGLTRHADVKPPFLQAHVDSLFADGVTEHGERYLLKGNMPAKNVNSIIDLLFEYVRRSHYPDRPSRFQSVFAWASAEDAAAFRAKHGTPTSAIWEVEAEQSFKGNMRLLTLANSLLVLSWRAHAYWQGESGQAVPELWEHLLVPPVRVVNLVE